MRTNGILNFLLGDHLGSTSLITDANGVVVSETRYKAWGEVRYSPGTKQTKYGYTGQYSYAADFGLEFFNARWYDSSLGRFAQADTIVPGGVQGMDRYAYANNSPINYTDPTGHSGCTILIDGEYCSRGGNISPLPDDLQTSYNAGQDFVNILKSQQGYWSQHMSGSSPEEMIDYLVKVVADFEGYSYSESGVCSNSAENSKCTFQKDLIEAVTRKVYDFYNKYGVNGLYVGLGSYEVVRRRVDLYHGENKYNHNPDKEQKPLDYLMTPFHFDRVEYVWNQSFSSSWRNGAVGNRPYDIGNPSVASAKLLAALNNIGPASNQVLFISDDKLAFILTLDQSTCLDPNRNLCP